MVKNAISWEEKFDKDIFYVDNVSFALDCMYYPLFGKCLCQRSGHATMPNSLAATTQAVLLKEWNLTFKKVSV